MLSEEPSSWKDEDDRAIVSWANVNTRSVTPILVVFRYVATMQSACGHHMPSIWASCGHHVDSIFLQIGHNLVTLWPPCDHHVVIMWSPCSYHVVTVPLLYFYYMVITWSIFSVPLWSICSQHVVSICSSCCHHELPSFSTSQFLESWQP